MLQVFQSADLQFYIEMYVWESEPLMTNIFYDVEFVQFSARLERSFVAPFYAGADQNGKLSH